MRKRIFILSVLLLLTIYFSVYLYLLKRPVWENGFLRHLTIHPVVSPEYSINTTFLHNFFYSAFILDCRIRPWYWNGVGDKRFCGCGLFIPLDYISVKGKIIYYEKSFILKGLLLLPLIIAGIIFIELWCILFDRLGIVIGIIKINNGDSIRIFSVRGFVTCVFWYGILIFAIPFALLMTVVGPTLSYQCYYSDTYSEILRLLAFGSIAGIIMGIILWLLWVLMNKRQLHKQKYA